MKNTNVIRTVLGDIDAGSLGVCYAHEHIIVDPCFMTQADPEFRLDSLENACAELQAASAAGLRAVVDAQPCDAGRNAAKLAEVSRRTGIRIICSTGLHLRKYYPPDHWRDRLSAEQLAAIFIAEVEQGIEAGDGIELMGEPAWRRADAGEVSPPFRWRLEVIGEPTGRRAGVIKVASGLNALSEHERTVFEAAALAHKATGAPILTHTEQGTAGLEQIRLLSDGGVPCSKVILSHTDRKPDASYHTEMLSTGAYLEYDSAFRWKDEPGNPTLDMVLAAFRNGFGAQVLLGTDSGRRRYWKNYGGGPGLAYLLKKFAPMLLDAGLSGEDLQRIFIGNPACAFSLGEAKS